jgi:L-alanine-DL-glutamate epimerase-like enolase superfamily enzyme
MDYHLRIADEPVAAGGAVVENGRVVMPTGPGLGLEIDEDLLCRLSERK